MKNNHMQKMLLTFLILASLMFVQTHAAQAGFVALQPDAEDSYGVTLEPTSASKSGAIGTSVTYMLSLRNTGTSSDTFQLNCSSSWATTCQVDIGPVEAGSTSKFPVKVSIPATAASGAIDTTTVTLTSAGNPAITASASLTTTAAFARPLVVVSTYYINEGSITPGQDFTLSLNLTNEGKNSAANLVMTFESTDFYPRESGGVNAIPSLGAGSSTTITQVMASSSALSGNSIGILAGKLSYTDPLGNPYTETFTFTINLKTPDYTSYQATPTPTTTLRPQLVISQYVVNVDPLQPGSIFNLDVQVHNLGSAEARAVTMVIGGSVIPEDTGTPSPVGVSGGGSDLTNFAPLGSSNLVYVGDINAGAVKDLTSQLIVNVSTQPGVYTLKLSFVYNDNKGNRIVDDQVITLLVYSLPQIEVSFYRDPGVLFTGQPNVLPLQITNLGKKTVVLGNIKVTTLSAELTNNMTLVGPLDIGGYYTLDAQIIPIQAGTISLEIIINYTDDFNQPRSINQTLEVVAEEMPTPESGYSDGTNGEVLPSESNVETTGQKILRFFKGLLGLGSGIPQPEIILPFTDGYPEEPLIPVPVP